MEEQNIDTKTLAITNATLKLLISLKSYVTPYKQGDLSQEYSIGDADNKGLKYSLSYNKSTHNYELRRSLNNQKSELIYVCSEQTKDPTEKELIDIYKKMENTVTKQMEAATKQVAQMSTETVYTI